MNKRIVFRHMEHSSILENEIHQELNKIEEFLKTDRTPQEIDVVLEFHPTHAHNSCEVRIFSPSYRVIVKKEGQELRPLIGAALDEAYEALHRQKEKWTDKDKQGCVQDCTDLLKRQLKKD